MRRIRSGCGLACTLLVSPSLAMAEEEPFGTRGQVVITSAFANALVAEHVWGGALGVKTSSIGLRPGADMFVLPGFSVGAHIGYARTWTDGPYLHLTQDDLLWGPSLGYAWNLSERLSLWPTLGADFIVSWRHGNSGYETPEPIKRIGYGLALPLLFHVAPHFFMGIGPTVWSYSASWSGANRFTRISAETLIGGWF